MKIFKDMKIIPLKNSNIELKNPQNLIDMIYDVPIISTNKNGKEILIGKVLGKDKYIKDDFIYSDIMLFGEYSIKHKRIKYKYENAEINCEDNKATKIIAIYYIRSNPHNKTN
ncbi:MAG: hypothetical protein RR255_00075 [Bacilli bacterium]